jgi:hypothetical protein
MLKNFVSVQQLLEFSFSYSSELFLFNWLLIFIRFGTTPFAYCYVSDLFVVIVIRLAQGVIYTKIVWPIFTYTYRCQIVLCLHLMIYCFWLLKCQYLFTFILVSVDLVLILLLWVRLTFYNSSFSRVYWVLVNCFTLRRDRGLNCWSRRVFLIKILRLLLIFFCSFLWRASCRLYYLINIKFCVTGRSLFFAIVGLNINIVTQTSEITLRLFLTFGCMWNIHVFVSCLRRRGNDTFCDVRAFVCWLN